MGVVPNLASKSESVACILASVGAGISLKNIGHHKDSSFKISENKNTTNFPVDDFLKEQITCVHSFSHDFEESSIFKTESLSSRVFDDKFESSVTLKPLETNVKFRTESLFKT